MIQFPNLDDRTFADLVVEARERIERTCPAWTDTSPNDPGMVLVETFAHLTEVLLYRLNQVPDKVHIALLDLLGVTLDPPSAARVTLEVTAEEGRTTPVEIPAGTAVSTAAGGTDGPVFRTLSRVQLAGEGDQATVEAIDAEWVAAEKVGIGTGRTGQSVRVARPPMVVGPPPSGDSSSGVGAQRVGVAVATDERGDLRIGQQDFAVWQEVPEFGPDCPERCFVVDMASGLIQFAGAEDRAASPVRVPDQGRQIVAWYWTGGGPDGNVDPHTLVRFASSFPKVAVTNPSAALGGRAMESVASARRRASAAIHSMDACVTRRDYERAARRTPGVARARAMTRAAVWQHAQPGEVEVVLVPAIEGDRPIDTALLHQHQDAAVRDAVAVALSERQVLGASTEVTWANVRTVSARGVMRVRAEEDADAVRQRVLDRLYGTITPLRTSYSEEGWSFGRDLYASDIYDIVLAEPAVNHVERVRLVVDNVPARDVTSIARDWYQDQTWFVAAGDGIFRTRDDGQSWEALRLFEGDEITCIETHPGRDVDRGGAARRGLVAAVRSGHDDAGNPTSTLMVSRDLGESWTSTVSAGYEITDLAWLDDGPQPQILLATESGLFRAGLEAGVPAVPITVDQDQPELGFFAVTAYRRANATVEVAVASMGRGVYGSGAAGASGTYEKWELPHDVRVLESEYDGNATHLWAGAVRGGDDVAPFRMHRDDASPVFRQITDGWTGEGCTAIAFGDGVVAGSYSAGTLRLVRGDAGDRWQRSGIDSGLPIRDQEGFLLESIRSLAMRDSMVLAGTSRGVYRQDTDDVRFDAAATEEFTDSVSLPDGWLFCSGQHEVEAAAWTPR
jgi:Baseplate J-like protein